KRWRESLDPKTLSGRLCQTPTQKKGAWHKRLYNMICQRSLRRWMSGIRCSEKMGRHEFLVRKRVRRQSKSRSWKARSANWRMLSRKNLVLIIEIKPARERREGAGLD